MTSINCITVGDELEVIVFFLLALFAEKSNGKSTKSRHRGVHMLRRWNGGRNDNGLGCRMRRRLWQLQAGTVVDGGAGGIGAAGIRHRVGGGADAGDRRIVGLGASNDGICRWFFRSL